MGVFFSNYTWLSTRALGFSSFLSVMTPVQQQLTCCENFRVTAYPKGNFYEKQLEISGKSKNTSN